jgi:hypothetical protein
MQTGRVEGRTLVAHHETAPLAQNGALKTAPCAQNGAVHSNAAARSKRRRAFKRCCALKTARRAQNGAARSNGVVRSNEGRQGVGKGSAD